MKTRAAQIMDQLPPTVLNSINNEDDIVIVQSDKSTIWARVYRFDRKYTEKITVALTPTGRVRKNSVRFYE